MDGRIPKNCERGKKLYLKEDYADLRNDLVETYFLLNSLVCFQLPASDLYLKLYNYAITELTLTLAIEQIPLKHVQYLTHLAKHVDIHVAALL